MIEIGLNKVYFIIIIILILFALGFSISVYYLYLSRKFFLYLKSTNKKRWESFVYKYVTLLPNSPIPKTIRIIPYILSRKDEENIQIKSLKAKLRLVLILNWIILGIMILGIVMLYLQLELITIY